MRMNRLSLITSLVFVWSHASVDAQSSRVGWYAFDAGFAVPAAPNTAIKSAVGQVVVGSTQQPTDFLTSGFLANPLLRGILVNVGEAKELPLSYSLSQNYPNPFNPSTRIEYQLPIQSHITLKIYDLLGREVATLVNEEKQPGTYAVQWDASGVASGVYFYRLEAGSFTSVKKLLLLR